MKFNCKLIVLCISLISNIFASVLNSSAPTIQPNLSNLSNIDNDTDNLNQLKRKVQIEKAQAELKKIKSGEVVTNKGKTISDENAQTTVTGVALNQDGKKIAWLQFVDGGSLTVNIGSQVGKYTVVDISMAGVTLSYTSGNKHKKNKIIYLKRTYIAADSGKKTALNNANMFFTPSPVLTGANALNGENTMVPPIVTAK